MRIDLIAPPMRGHLHPLLGIGRRLARDAHVRVISSAAALPAIAAAGLAGHALCDGIDAAVGAIVNPPHRVRANPLRLHRQLRANLALMAQFRAELDALYAHGRPQLLLADFTLPVAGSVARAHGIPWWTTLPSPCVLETPDGPPAYLGGWHPRDDAFGKMRDAFGRALVRTFKRGVFALHRAPLRALGLAQPYRADGSEAVYSDQRILALGLRELEFPRCWPRALTFTGPVLYTPPYAGPAPQFVPGRRHVLVTSGTHLKWLKSALRDAVAAAARALPEIEFHLSDGDAGAGAQHAQANLQWRSYIAYDAWLPRYDAVVHHGGAGVMYECLRAGKPALVLPVDYDQFDNAARLQAAGVARVARGLGALADGVRQVLDDDAMRQRCAYWCRSLQPGAAEDAIAALVLGGTLAQR